MARHRYLLVEVLLIAAAVTVTALVYSRLPARVPIHWGFNGRANDYGPRWILFVFGPGLMAAITVLSAIGPWLSPKQFSVENFRSTYQSVMLILVCLMGYIEMVIAWSCIHRDRADAKQFVIGGVCVFFALAGNMLGKVRRNFFIGVRTPWTLANERVWNATHRFAAKVFIAAGIVGLALAFRGSLRGPLIAILVGAALPVIYSLVYYKKLQRLGEL